MHRSLATSRSTPVHAEDRLLKAEEAARVLAVSTRFVWRLRSEGKLPAVQIAGATRFRLSDVNNLVQHGAKGGA